MPHWTHLFQTHLPKASLAILVTIEQIRGSTPRETGTSMLVLPEQFYGTIGGGNLEYQALKIARHQLEENTPDQVQRFPLAASLGQCCGGWVSLSFKAITPDQEWCESYLKQQEMVSACLPILLFGAGHVGNALVNVLQNLPCKVTWVDEREECFPKQVGDNINIVCHDDPVSEITEAPDNSHCLIMTHSHALDFELVSEALTHHFPYLGLIGSQTKRKSFEQRLQQRGISQSTLDALTCPIGIEGINNKSPEVIAISVVAQLLKLQD